MVRRAVIGFLVFVGASAAAGFIVRMTLPEFGTGEDDTFALVASMAERRFHSTAGALQSGTATAFMGSIVLDLRNAAFDRMATLRLRAVMGGVEVIVPETWRVEAIAQVIMGDLVNRTHPDDLIETAPLLLVDATAVMGGVIIHDGEGA
jgi:hypothetical protein